MEAEQVPVEGFANSVGLGSGLCRQTAAFFFHFLYELGFVLKKGYCSDGIHNSMAERGGRNVRRSVESVLNIENAGSHQGLCQSAGSCAYQSVFSRNLTVCKARRHFL